MLFYSKYDLYIGSNSLQNYFKPTIALFIYSFVWWVSTGQRAGWGLEVPGEPRPCRGTCLWRQQGYHHHGASRRVSTAIHGGVSTERRFTPRVGSWTSCPCNPQHLCIYRYTETPRGQAGLGQLALKTTQMHDLPWGRVQTPGPC